MNSRPRFYDDPATPLVALSGGPQNGRWYFYRDWLALRESSHRGRYPLHHPCGSPRCYLPTEHMAVNGNPSITRQHGAARTWEWVPPEQWARWEDLDLIANRQVPAWAHEYQTPEEKNAYDRRYAAWPVEPLTIPLPPPRTQRFLITGSRDWTDVPYIRDRLAEAIRDRLIDTHSRAILVHGDCRGADRIAAGIWTHWGMQTEAHPVDWTGPCDQTCDHGPRRPDRHGNGTSCPNAGPRRNRHMVELGADLCLAFLLPGSRGAVQCARLADKAGITTKRFDINHDGRAAA